LPCFYVNFFIKLDNLFVDDCATLKANLTDEIEYSLMPKPAWDKLVSWYGLQQDQVCITKKQNKMPYSSSNSICTIYDNFKVVGKYFKYYMIHLDRIF